MKDAIYFLSEQSAGQKHAGSKARNDVERIFRESGFIAFEHMEVYTPSSLIHRFLRRLTVDHLKKIYRFLTLRGKVVFLQYPFPCDRFTYKAVCHLLQKNHALLVVHDVDALWDAGRYSLAEEARMLCMADALVVHNARMAAVLRKHGVDVPMMELGIFDYLLSEPFPETERHLGPSIAFAGNLEKSRFLHGASMAALPLDIHLYGPNFSAEQIAGERVQYHGAFPPDQLPYELDGSFGLVWDGDSITSCTGPFGQYLRYNNPHKFSLFIAAGMPVITWREAAIAEFIEREGIGFCVDSLPEIPERIAALSEETYQGYRHRLRALQQRVCTGFYMRRAVKQALEQVKE